VVAVPFNKQPDRIGGWIVGAPYPHVQTDERGTRGLTH